MFLKSFLVLVTKASRRVWSWLMSVSSAVGIHISRNIATITRLAKCSKGYPFRKSASKETLWMAWMYATYSELGCHSRT
ncbi:Uncharacterized protein HZ326_18985 [Fusarium oxysporum f. sp. albedinis]|nr:Uncharacterized protein HZ326_18985 [Fusarium oxysporum f. sp. albedinis]